MCVSYRSEWQIPVILVLLTGSIIEVSIFKTHEPAITKLVRKRILVAGKHLDVIVLYMVLTKDDDKNLKP